MNTEDTAWVAWGTVNIGPHTAIQLKEVNVAELANQLELDQIALEQEVANHPPDCGWWQDWHNCTCHVFNND